MDALTIILISAAVLAIVAILFLAFFQKPGSTRARPSPPAPVPTPTAAPTPPPAVASAPPPAAARPVVVTAPPAPALAPTPAPAPPPTPEPVAESPARNLDELDADRRAALACLSIMPGPFDRAAGCAVAECADGDLDRFVALEALAFDAAGGRFELREITHHIAAENLAPDDEHAARLRHAAHFARRAIALDELQQSAGNDRPGTDRALQAIDQFDADRPHFEAAFEFMQRTPDLDRQLVDFVGTIGATAGVQLAPADHHRWLEARLAAARRLGDRAAECDTLGMLGLACTDAGEHRKALAHHEAALALARELGDRLAEGRNLGNMALSSHRLGNPAGAIARYEEVLVVMREIGDRPRESIALLSLGQAHADTGNHARAVELLEQHLALARDLRDRRGEFASLGALGHARIALGDTAAAQQHFEQQLQISRTLRELPAEGNALSNLGTLHLRTKQYDDAISVFEQLVHLTQLLAEPAHECIAVGRLGEAHLAAGHTSRAIDCFDTQLKLARQTDNRRAEGEAHWHTALAIHSRGQINDAVTRGEVALHVFDEVEAPQLAEVRATLAGWRKQA